MSALQENRRRWNDSQAVSTRHLESQKMYARSIYCLPPILKKKGKIRAIVYRPTGNRNNFDFDPAIGLFGLDSGIPRELFDRERGQGCRDQSPMRRRSSHLPKISLKAHALSDLEARRRSARFACQAFSPRQCGVESRVVALVQSARIREPPSERQQKVGVLLVC